MQNEEFATIVDDTIRQIRSVLYNKQSEYADDHDVLHNFEMAATMMRTNQRGALKGFLTKHVVSIYDMMDEDELRPDEVWDEKIGDAINYLILLKAIVIEERRQNLPHTQAGLSRSGFPVLISDPNNKKDI